MRALLACLLLLQPQEAAPQDPWKNGSLQITEKNPLTGNDEVSAVIRFAEATPVDLAKKIFDFKGVSADYYTDPRKQGAKSDKLVFTADSAHLDGQPQQLQLRGRVRIRHEDGTLLEASEIDVDSAKKTFATDKDFTLDRPGFYHLSGQGLRADDKLREMTVSRGATLEVKGRPQDLKTPSPRAPKPVRTRLTCAGPLALREPKDAEWRAFVRASDKVRMEREDDRGRVEIAADVADTVIVKRIDPVTNREEVDAESLVATGGLSMKDSRGSEAKAERLEWTFLDDVARLGGSSRVEARQGMNLVRADAVEIERAMGLSKFTGDVEADLARTEGAPQKLRARRLEVRADPLTNEMLDMEARDGVKIDDLAAAPGQPPGRAEADRFFWSEREQRGLLEARPFVRVVQGSSTALAPVMILTGKSAIVLKGPKRIRVLQERDGKTLEMSASAEGDIVLDTATGRIRMSDRCLLRTSEFRLYADELDMTTAPEGRGLDAVRASGHVRAHRFKEGSTLYGDRLRYDPKDEAVSVRGLPFAVMDAGRYTSFQPELRFNERTKRSETEGGVEIIIREDNR